jgi:hypothetical protein
MENNSRKPSSFADESTLTPLCHIKSKDGLCVTLKHRTHFTI